MSNRLALILGSLIVAAVLADQFANNGVGSLFLARKLLEFIEWLAFWR